MDVIVEIPLNRSLDRSAVEEDLRSCYPFAVVRGQGATVAFAPYRGDAEDAWPRRHRKLSMRRCGRRPDE